MMNKLIKATTVLISLLLCFVSVNGQQAFTVIPLGVSGGNDESNLSSYMVARKNSDRYILMDAGTIHAGIGQAIKQKSLEGDV